MVRPQTYIIDGSSGFNATWQIQTLLQRGHHVVVSVRSSSKGAFLDSLFRPTFGSQFSYVIDHQSSSSSSPSSRSSSMSRSSSAGLSSSPVLSPVNMAPPKRRNSDDSLSSMDLFDSPPQQSQPALFAVSL